MLYKVTQCAGCVMANTCMHLSQIPLVKLAILSYRDGEKSNPLKNNNWDQSLDFLNTIVSTFIHYQT